MSFLKKLGSVLLQVGKAAPMVGPIISAVIPGTKDDAIIARATTTLDQLAGIVVTTEAIGQALKLTGTQKLTGATPLIAQAVLQSSLLAGRQPADPAKFQAGCEKIGSGLADVLNSLNADDLPDAPSGESAPVPAPPVEPAPPTA